MAKKWKKPRKTRFTATKFFLIVLVIACLVATVWAGYLLFTHQTNPIVGGVILLADIAVLFWNMSTLRRSRVQLSSVFVICIVLALLASTTGACAGITPLAAAKAKAEIWSVKFSGEAVDPSSIIFPSARVKEGIVVFEVRVKPFNVSIGEAYTVCLLSNGGYFYDGEIVSWCENDFAGPVPGERDIGKIREAESRMNRLVTLVAPSSDKDLVGLMKECMTVRDEKMGDVRPFRPLGMTEGLSESEIDKICRKYVEVVVVDSEGLEQLLEEK